MSEQKETGALEIYQTWQRNNRRTEVLREEILRGSKAGESPCRLLLKAAEAISLMTGDPVFCREIETAMFALYGHALGEQEPLELELEKTTGQLQRIEAAMRETTDADLLHGMDLAARAHRRKISDLRVKLGLEEEQEEHTVSVSEEEDE